MTPFYESDRAVSEYLLFHYGDSQEILPYKGGPVEALDYPVRCVNHFASDIQYSDGMRALDLGCAVGRSTFELARFCGEVIGIDYSERFVASGDRLRESGELAYSFVDHGELTRDAVARIPKEIDRSRVRFEQGDAMFLREGLGVFDVILMANLIDRLVDPSKCLSSLAELVRAGGYVILTSPYTWLEEYTPKDHWIGGKSLGEQVLSTEDALCEVMGESFEMVGRDDLPFLIREHARKYQWSVAQGTLWRRK
ncbi:MAG: putative 4-mercaptohistidine N1-methyltransferase [Verrucomicrobia bacterium]|jgi:putative 4-mercaptohistidine N1-methyltranferase|nr:putative 4-mercaptohistidine N1-methyltransferase [Verrucomicrobiota bacterium]MDB4745659.1 putative 4-mercaptohistidine N1-methyltransferase [Verrucomicrobiota bacterium]